MNCVNRRKEFWIIGNMGERVTKFVKTIHLCVCFCFLENPHDFFPSGLSNTTDHYSPNFVSDSQGIWLYLYLFIFLYCVNKLKMKWVLLKTFEPGIKGYINKTNLGKLTEVSCKTYNHKIRNKSLIIFSDTFGQIRLYQNYQLQWNDQQIWRIQCKQYNMQCKTAHMFI